MIDALVSGYMVALVQRVRIILLEWVIGSKCHAHLVLICHCLLTTIDALLPLIESFLQFVVCKFFCLFILILAHITLMGKQTK